MKTLCLIILILISGSSAFGRATVTRLQRVKMAILLQTRILDALKARNGRFPTTAEWRDVMLTGQVNFPPEVLIGSHLEPHDLIDPWGHDYVYRCPGLHSTNGFDLYSCGRDGISATGGSDPDDINNWDANSPTGPRWDDAPLCWPVLCSIGAMAFALFIWTTWKDIRRPKPSGNLDGMPAMFLLVAVVCQYWALSSVLPRPNAG